MYLQTLRWYRLQHTLQTEAMWYILEILGYKPLQCVTMLNTVGSCNTIVVFVYLNISKHKKAKHYVMMAIMSLVDRNFLSPF